MPIRVNDTEISDETIFEEMQYHPAQSLEIAQQQASEALVIKQLLLQAAKEKDLLEDIVEEKPDELERAVDQLIAQEVTVPFADLETCERYYRQNKERFVDPTTKQLLPFDSVHTHIRDYLCARSLKTGISQYIKILAGKATISGFEFDGAESSLVQ